MLSGRLALLSHRAPCVSLPLHPTDDPDALAASTSRSGTSMKGGRFRDRGSKQRRASFRRALVIGVKQPNASSCLPQSSRCKAARSFPYSRQANCSAGLKPTVSPMEVSSGHLRSRRFGKFNALAEHGEDGKKAAAETTSESACRHVEGHGVGFLAARLAGVHAHQHGDKVKQADKLLLAGCTERGERDGRDMSAVREILRRWR